MASRTTRLARALRRVEPPPRTVDWSIFALVVFETLSGVLNLGAGHPTNSLLFVAHDVTGLSLVALVGFKLYRVRRCIPDARLHSRHTALLVLLAVVALASLDTSIARVLGVEVRIGFWTLSSVHIGSGLLVVPVPFFHLWVRLRPPHRIDLAEQRRTLQYNAILVFSAATYRATETAGALWGVGRQFTGSRPFSPGEGSDALPMTSWVADDPDPVDPDSWSLSVTGLVNRSLELDRADLAPGETRSILLGYTGGWYTEQCWTSVRLGDALGVTDVHSSMR